MKKNIFVTIGALALFMVSCKQKEQKQEQKVIKRKPPRARGEFLGLPRYSENERAARSLLQ